MTAAAQSRWRMKRSSAAGIDFSVGWSLQGWTWRPCAAWKTATRVWDRHGRKRAYLDHRGRRLKAARALIDSAEFEKQVEETERIYLKAASNAQRRRSFTVGVIALLIMTAGGAVAWLFESDVSPRQISSTLPRAIAELKVLAAKAWLVTLEPEMETLEGGTFLMGAFARSSRWYYLDEGWGYDELPQHVVTVPAFAISKYEVTFADWHVCVFDGGCNEYHPSNAGWESDKRPVINVSWDNAQAYVKWLSEATGETYRLPSEAEWEFAARAGTYTRYVWGPDDPTPEQANFGHSFEVGKTAEVGSYPPNPWGLHDMQGNVWEWVEDCWNDSYHDAPTDGSSWTSGDCSNRILRGGGWLDGPEYLRSADRGKNTTNFRSELLGFRVAKTLSPGESVTP